MWFEFTEDMQMFKVSQVLIFEWDLMFYGNSLKDSYDDAEVLFS
jgi:hypothetical protein